MKNSSASFSRCLAVVTARRGSKGVPGKNVMPLLGQPAITHTLRLALGIPEIDRLVVSTDCPVATRVAERNGVEVIPRPAALARNRSPVTDALRHAVRALEARGERYGIVLLLYANIPYRRPEIVRQAVRKMRTGKWDSILSLCPVGNFHPQWVYRLEKESVVPYQNTAIYRRQDLPPVFAHTGACVALRTRVLMDAEGDPDPNAFLGTRVGHVLHGRWDAVEIDDPEEARFAEALLRQTEEKRKCSPKP